MTPQATKTVKRKTVTVVEVYCPTSRIDSLMQFKSNGSGFLDEDVSLLTVASLSKTCRRDHLYRITIERIDLPTKGRKR